MANKPGGGFAFLDAGDAARRLGIDRLTLDHWVKEGRLKTHRGMGRDVFFRARDINELYQELYPDAALAEAIAADEAESEENVDSAAPVRKKQHDPQMRVYLRLQADAKWYDISAEDIKQWAQQLAPERYERNKQNVQHTINKLRYVVNRIETTQQREAGRQ
jgi:hypothetical protein